MDEVAQDQPRRKQRAERIDAWFERKWPNKYERFVARLAIYGGIGVAWGALGGQLIGAISR